MKTQPKYLGCWVVMTITRRIYTDEMKEHMKKVVPNRRMKEVTKLMNDKFGTEFTVSQLTNLKARMRLKSGLPTNVKGQNKMFTDKQEEFIRGHVKGLLNKELTELVNKEFNTHFTVGQIRNYKARNKLSSGIKTTFKKGRAPFNKGMKQSDYMSAEAIERTKNTRFQKGQNPINWKPIGYERITRDGYTEVKVRDFKGIHSAENFELKHRILWEKHHGEIPEEHIVIFKNGDPQDIRIENLMMIPRKVALKLNQFELKSEFPEITELGVSLVKLQYKTKEREQNAQTIKTIPVEEA